MNFSNYITESDKIDSLFDTLNKECSQFIKEYKRGICSFVRTSESYESKFTVDMFSVKQRTDRRPSDTPLLVHNRIDELLKSKFGWKPRSEGLFAWIAKNRGSTWHWNRISNFSKIIRIVFPTNGYKYIYNDKIPDVFNKYTAIADYDYRPREELTSDDLLFLSWFETEALPLYKSSGALKVNKVSQIECMLSAPKFYMVSVLMIPHIVERLGINIDMSL
jgi:hypothetical protein